VGSAPLQRHGGACAALLLSLRSCCVAKESGHMGLPGRWRKDSGSRKCFWLSYGCVACPGMKISEAFDRLNDSFLELILPCSQCSAAAYLSYFFTDCLMSRWYMKIRLCSKLLVAPLSKCRLLFYTPSATVVRLLTTNFLIAYITSWVLYLSGAAEDPRMLLPAWVSIATVGFGSKGSDRVDSWLT